MGTRSHPTTPLHLTVEVPFEFFLEINGDRTAMVRIILWRPGDGATYNEILWSKDNFQHLRKQLDLYFCFGSTNIFYYAANKRFV